MLGIGNSLMSSAPTDFGIWDISSLVAHYDFSDASKLKQNDDGTTAVSSDGDPIGYAENLAANGLGLFVRSYNDAGRPLYKTGGQNSKSYAHFSGSSGCALIAGVVGNGSVIGGISDSAYSNVVMSTTAVSIFAVCATDIADISDSTPNFGESQVVLQMEGYEGEAYDRAAGIMNVVAYGGTGNRQAANFRYTSVGGVEILDSDDETEWDTATRLVTTISRPGTNATRLEKNLGASSAESTTGTISTGVIDMRYEVGTVKFGIGSNLNDYLNPNSMNWDGKIYEILVYNKAVNDEEKTLIKNYINSKYAIW